MKIHRRLIVLVGLGMLLIMTITVLSLENITTVFSQTTKSVAMISLEVRKVWNIERKLGDMARSVHEFVKTGDRKHRAEYDASRAAVHRMLNEVSAFDLGDREMKVLASMIGDFNVMEKKAERIFSLWTAAPAERTLVNNLVADLDSLLMWLDNDIERYKEENAVRLDDVVSGLRSTKVRVYLLFAILLLTMVGFLLGFGVYMYRRVSIPLGKLWEGTEAVSQGNLDYQMQLEGESDIVRLAERFNEMAQKLKVSYADLERRLLERTRQLGAINSVALTLGEAGSLKDVLQKSLAKILESFSDMEPRGGIFLCEPDGETLRLFAYLGLSPEFAKQEETIRMGECLCGIAARNGEMLFTEQGCGDPRHTRNLPVSNTDHSHIVVPIKSRGIVLGVIFLYPARNFSLKQSDIQMFDTIGAQLGMAVENLRLYGEVKESSVKFWDLFENSRDILFTVDTEGRLTAVNEAAERFTGLSKVELTGKSVLDFLTEEGKKAARRMIAEEQSGERTMFEFEVQKPDGSRAFVEISGRNIYKNRTLIGFQMAARDVTYQKSLRELLVQAERIAAIGQVGIAVRHEVNNPLTTVIGNTELLLERYEDGDEELRKRLATILDNALRIAEIVKRLQEIKQDKIVEYLKGVKMTDLKQG